MIVTPNYYKYMSLMKINTLHSYPITPKLQVCPFKVLPAQKKQKLATDLIMPRFTIAQVGNKELKIKKVNDMRKINAQIGCSQLL
jgi:hypothetical protein